MSKLEQAIVKWLRQQVEGAGAKGLVLGLSGGIDSALAAGLAKRAFPENSLGLIMPCHSAAEDEKLALMVAEQFEFKTSKIALCPVFDQLLDLLGSAAADPNCRKLAEANLKARMRMATLYYHANLMNYLVCGTSTTSEVMLGYFTKYGDNGVDLMPLGGLLKGEVRALSAAMGVPQEIIDRPPTGGLWKGQTDEREMGVSYAKIDEYLSSLTSGRRKGLAKREEDRIMELMTKSNHKREKPPVFTQGSNQ